MKKSIKTEIHIAANPAQVWEVLTNFAEYPDWNPFVKSVTGHPAVGERIQIQLPGMAFKPKVKVFSPGHEFRWLGKLLFKGLFDGEHYFQLLDNGDGTTTFIHGENFSGILVGLFANSLETNTKAGFESMNVSLKSRAESK